jgi:hypothetical protein
LLVQLDCFLLPFFLCLLNSFLASTLWHLLRVPLAACNRFFDALPLLSAGVGGYVYIYDITFIVQYIYIYTWHHINHINQYKSYISCVSYISYMCIYIYISYIIYIYIKYLSYIYTYGDITIHQIICIYIYIYVHFYLFWILCIISALVS